MVDLSVLSLSRPDFTTDAQWAAAAVVPDPVHVALFANADGSHTRLHVYYMKNGQLWGRSLAEDGRKVGDRRVFV